MSKLSIAGLLSAAYLFFDIGRRYQEWHYKKVKTNTATPPAPPTPDSADEMFEAMWNKVPVEGRYHTTVTHADLPEGEKVLAYTETREANEQGILINVSGTYVTVTRSLSTGEYTFAYANDEAMEVEDALKQLTTLSKLHYLTNYF